MILRYNRFALIPHTCNQCEKIFWLEWYREDGDFGDHDRVCKRCIDEEDKK